MLTPEQKAAAELRLKMMQSQKQFENKVKDTVKNSTKKIQQLIASLSDNPKQQRNVLKLIQNKLIPKVLALEQLNKHFQETQEKMKADNQKLNKDKLFALQDKEQFKIKIQQLKETIKKIQDTVRDSIEQQKKKRQKIEQDLELSLGEIRQKISTFETQSVDMDKQNEELRKKKAQIEEKMGMLETNFKAKAQSKDNEVKQQKEQMMGKLQALEGEVSEVTQINKEYSAVEKNNFDKKLSLYLKTKKFPQYSSSFENSARTIDQCKQELSKGVQRLNQAKDHIQKYEKESKDSGNNYLVELKSKTQKQAKILAIKKQKEVVRQRILALQNKAKQQAGSTA